MPQEEAEKEIPPKNSAPLTQPTGIYDGKAKGLKYKMGAAAISMLNFLVPRRLFISRTWFRHWEKLGVHILAADFNSPSPIIKDLPNDLWKQRSAVVGIDLRDEEQLRLLDLIAAKYKTEYDAFPVKPATEQSGFYLGNAWFEKVDAELLYSLTRELKPKRIIEVGSGFSTKLAVQAIRRNTSSDPSYRCDILAIEPYANRVADDEFPGTMKMIRRPVQNVELEVFEQLQENDFLFVDSTHVGKIGSDVIFEVCEILPRLRSGVYVHFHDIFMPYEYPRIWVVEDHNFYVEQYLLQAFLTFNPKFEVIWASYYMLQKYPDRLRKAFGNFDKPIWPEQRFLPGSLWLRVR